MIEKHYYNGAELALCCQILGSSLDDALSSIRDTKCPSRLRDLRLTGNESSRVFDHIVNQYGKDDFHLKLANGLVTEPLGASHIGFMSSTHLNAGLQRLSQSKKILTPIIWDYQSHTNYVEIQILQKDHEFPVNGFIEIMSFIWIVKCTRAYTRKDIVPLNITISSDISYKAEIEAELGCEITIADKGSIRFDFPTATLPFNTANETVRNIIDAEISRKLSLLDNQSDFTELVKSHIQTVLPSGDITAERIARFFLMSKRTFERKLSVEGSSFSKILDDVRSDLAMKYLTISSYTTSEITFMLGFKEKNSFYRAFKKWHGVTPNSIRVLDTLY